LEPDPIRTCRTRTAIHDQYAIQAALKSPELQKEFAREGATTAAMSSAAFDAFIKSEIAKWSPVVKDDNIQAQ